MLGYLSKSMNIKKRYVYYISFNFFLISEYGFKFETKCPTADDLGWIDPKASVTPMDGIGYYVTLLFYFMLPTSGNTHKSGFTWKAALHCISVPWEESNISWKSLYLRALYLDIWTCWCRLLNAKQARAVPTLHL